MGAAHLESGSTACVISNLHLQGILPPKLVRGSQHATNAYAIVCHRMHARALAKFTAYHTPRTHTLPLIICLPNTLTLVHFTTTKVILANPLRHLWLLPAASWFPLSLPLPDDITLCLITTAATSLPEPPLSIQSAQ